MERKKREITPTQQINNSIIALRGQIPLDRSRIEKLIKLKENIKAKQAHRR